MSVIKCRSDSDFENHVKENDKVIIHFMATWCGMSKIMRKYFENMSTQHEEVTFLEVDIDIDSLSETVEKWEIRSVPTVFSVLRGSKFGTFIGTSETKLNDKVLELIAN